MSNLCTEEFGNSSDSIVRLMGFPNHAHLGALTLEIGLPLFELSSRILFDLRRSIHFSLLAQEEVSKENKVVRQDSLKQRIACVVDR